VTKERKWNGRDPQAGNQKSQLGGRGEPSQKKKFSLKDLIWNKGLRGLERKAVHQKGTEEIWGERSLGGERLLGQTQLKKCQDT